MKRILALAFAGALAAILAGCGGGGGPTITPPPTVTPPPPAQYAGVANLLGEDCAYAVGVITTTWGTTSGARDSAYRTCESAGTNAAAGAARDRCNAIWRSDCSAVAVGINDARPMRECAIRTRHSQSLSTAESEALNACRSDLGATADCEVLVSGCPSGLPSSLVWRPPETSPPPPPPPGGIDRSQVGNEFGRTSTTGRNNLNLTCTDDVVFSDSGNVVLPSVDVVALPSEAGTVTLEYDAYNIPDRFVVEVGGRVVIDTRYVGTERTVAEINAVLTAYGFTPTSQANIISPGDGTRSFQKAAGVTSAIVRVYAPLTGTAWEVTLKFSSSSCPGTGPGGRDPGTPVRNVNVTIPASCAREVQVCVRDHQCEDGDQIRVSLNSQVIFSGELFNAWNCQNVPVQQGTNRFELFAINGTGFKGNCNHSDENTGEIVITGGNTRGSQSWQHAGGTGSRANLNVTIGPAGGTCTPTGSEPGSNTGTGTGSYGAIATSLEPRCSGHYAGAAITDSRGGARSAATAYCRSAGGTDCSFHADFGSAYTGNVDCASVAYGTRTSGSTTFCNIYVGRGGSESAAESDARSECRSEMTSCSILPSRSGGNFTNCAH